MRFPVRHIITSLALCVALLAAAQPAAAKRYVFERDKSTGKLKVTEVDTTNQSLASKAIDTVLSPIKKVKNYVLGTTTNNKALPGFGSKPLTQAQMQKPQPGMIQTTARTGLRTVDAAAGTVGAPPVAEKSAGYVLSKINRTLGIGNSGQTASNVSSVNVSTPIQPVGSVAIPTGSN